MLMHVRLKRTSMMFLLQPALNVQGSPVLMSFSRWLKEGSRPTRLFPCKVVVTLYTVEIGIMLPLSGRQSELAQQAIHPWLYQLTSI